MKILVFNIAKPKEAAALFAYGIAKGLKENGVEVYALMQELVQNRKQWDELLDSKHVYYTDINNDVESHAKQLIRFYTREIRNINTFFDGIEFDIVLSTVFANWSTFFLPIFHTKERIAVCHDPLPHSGEKKLNAFLARRYYQKNNRLIVLTKRFREPASRRYGKSMESIITIPHGRMNNYESLKDPNKSQNYSPDKLNFIFFGRIEKYKGLRVLGNAYQILSQKTHDISLTIAGNGDFSEFEELYRGLPNTKCMIRYIEDDEVAGLFDGPNVVTVVPYIDATQSGIISVAMEYGTPIIASDTGGLREQLDDGRIGLFFEKGNSEQLAEVMERFVSDSNLFSEQRKLEEEYLQKLNWDVVMKEFISAL